MPHDLCRRSNEELWEQNRQTHCWMGDEDWETVHSYYGGDPIGHVFTNPFLFPEPILNVPGDRGYWRPNPKKLQFERQQKGFDVAISLLKQFDYKPDYRPEADLEKPKKQPKRQPNQITVYFGSHSIGFTSPNRVWDIDYPPLEFVEALRQQTDFFKPKDDSIGWLCMTPEEINTQYLRYASQAVKR